MVNYGGGLISGDKIQLECTIHDYCTVLFTTQSSTKIYEATATQIAEQTVQVVLGKDATFLYLPHFTTCYKNSRFKQKQDFYLKSTSNFILLDWVSSGRLTYVEKEKAMKEEWCFNLYDSFNKIYIEEEAIMMDHVILNFEEEEENQNENSLSKTQAKASMYGYHIIGFMVIYGTKLQRIIDKIKEETQAKREKKIMKNGSKQMLLTASSLPTNYQEGLVVRIAATSAQEVYTYLRETFEVLKEIIGYAPFADA